jgi:hypothetical protein
MSMTDTEALPPLATYARVPSGLIAISLGLVPTEMGCRKSVRWANAKSSLPWPLPGNLSALWSKGGLAGQLR